MAIEPGLDAVTYMGRSVDPGVLIMWNTYFLTLSAADEIGATLQGLDLADHRDRRRLAGT
jgi:hypothetical protein